VRALVTGAGGFVGQWLVRALLARGDDVTATALSSPAGGGAGEGVRWLVGDVRDAAHLEAALDAARPDVIVHLAGVTFVPHAAEDPGVAVEVNVAATARLLGLVRRRRRAGTLDPVVVVVGSAEQYGRHDAEELPLREDAEQRPHTVYAATKVAQEAVALEAFRSEGVRVLAARSFNHSGRGQQSRFLLPGLVARAKALAREGGGRLVMGNQAPVRDFLHVSDVVAAYIAMAERGAAGEAYNVASGRGYSTGEVAGRVLERLGVDAAVESDPSLVRPVDVPALVGDASKLRAASGWAPRLALDDILDDLIQHHDATPQ
jgi:GDP-4-dehydro-6-deoxy-D-mannose reductase